MVCVSIDSSGLYRLVCYLYRLVICGLCRLIVSTESGLQFLQILVIRDLYKFGRVLTLQILDVCGLYRFTHRLKVSTNLVWDFLPKEAWSLD